MEGQINMSPFEVKFQLRKRNMIRQVKCLVCTGVLKEVQDPLARLLMKAHLTVEYINPMVEGFHCRKQQCKELFHQFMPLKDNCCEIADLFMVELLCRATLSLFCLHVLRIQRVVSPDDGSEATTCRLAINLIKKIMDNSTAEQKAVRKHRARRALWRLANEPPADFDSQDPFDAMLMDRIEYYANGGWLGETGCLICSERGRVLMLDTGTRRRFFSSGVSTSTCVL